MSLYRFLRASALMTLAARYRGKLYRLSLAVAVALTTAWLYGDIADYLGERHPDTLWLALAVKTIIVYAVLVYAFWQLRPATDTIPDASGETGQSPVNPDAIAIKDGPLDALIDKPKLTTRREAILSNKGEDGP